MQVGFTGSRHEPNKLQKDWFVNILEKIIDQEAPEELLIGFHHGDCMGSDAYAHGVALSKKLWIVVHPPQSNALRAYCQGNEMMEPLNYLERNWEIVRQCDLLLALPSTNRDILRSGTWATIRYARKSNKPVHLCGPDGKERILG